MYQVVLMAVVNRVQGVCAMYADRWFKVKPVKRNQEEQVSLARESRRIHLYFCKSCINSIKIKRQCESLGLRVIEKDVKRISDYCNELLNGGGELRVPCLRIEGSNGKKARWLYGNDSISEYLERRFPS